MNNDSKTNYVKWTTFAFIAVLFIGVLGVVWNTLEGVRSDMTEVKSDIAVIKNQLNIRATSTSLLDKMYGK